MARLGHKYYRCTPIEGAWSFMADAISNLSGYVPLALIYRDSYFVPDGVLTRTGTGILVHFYGGSIRSIDQRKASTSLDRMEAIRRAREKAAAKGEQPEPYFDPEEEADDNAEEDAI